jgi:hypothetical protein
MIQRLQKPLCPAEPPPSQRGTPEALQRIREVIRNTATPSWLESAPHNFGDAAVGTLKADEWRSMATVYLPMALVSLWGEGSPSERGVDLAERRRVLDHTMALFSAVRLACLRTMTKARIDAYHECITTYIRDLPVLHPHAHPRPIYHMAQHIRRFLILFGPVRSWWCFPFERLVGLLQRIPKNHKFGTHCYASTERYF